MPPIIDEQACSRCGTCVEICPTDVFINTADKEIPFAKYGEECWHCNACVLDCPEKAISLRIPLPMLMLYVEKPMKG